MPGFHHQEEEPGQLKIIKFDDASRKIMTESTQNERKKNLKEENHSQKGYNKFSKETKPDLGNRVKKNSYQSAQFEEAKEKQREKLEVRFHSQNHRGEVEGEAFDGLEVYVAEEEESYEKKNKMFKRKKRGSDGSRDMRDHVQ